MHAAAVTKRRPRRAAVLGALAVALAVAGILIAVLSGGGGKPHQTNAATRANREVAAAAAYLGVPAPQLRLELHGGRTLEQIAHAHHKPVSGLVDALAGARSAATPRLASKPQNRRSARRRAEAAVKRVGFGAAPPIPTNLIVASHYLGIPTAHIRSQLRAGKTLAQIARATPGRSVTGLVDALIATRHTVLESILAQEPARAAYIHELLSSLHARMTAAVNTPATR
jgi:hypothetical protein